MQVRLAYETDVDAFVEMAKANIDETRPDMEWDEDTCRDTFWEYIDSASPTIWMCVKGEEPIGFLLADMYGFRAAKGLIVTQEVIFVRPAYRGSRAALLLMKELIAWAKQMGAKEIIGGNDNSFNSERTARFLEHFGFERVGFSMRRRL